jgi:hypothetical protein
MGMEMMEHWEVAVDGVQILLCLLILFYLVRNHRHKMNPDMMNLKRGSDQNFNLQVFSQAINQQVEMAFTNIQDVVADERRNLDKVLQLHPFNHADRSTPEIRPQALPSQRDGSFKHLKETTGSGESQTRIQQLASRGMSTKQISAELKKPLGEVELILSLQKNTEN